MIRYLIASFMTLGLLVPVASAKKNPHPAGSHRKPSKHAAAMRNHKNKPHKAQ